MAKLTLAQMRVELDAERAARIRGEQRIRELESELEALRAQRPAAKPVAVKPPRAPYVPTAEQVAFRARMEAAKAAAIATGTTIKV